MVRQYPSAFTRKTLVFRHEAAEVRLYLFKSTESAQESRLATYEADIKAEMKDKQRFLYRLHSTHPDLFVGCHWSCDFIRITDGRFFSIAIGIQCAITVLVSACPCALA